MNLPEWDQNGGEIGERTLYAVDLFTGEDVWTRSMGEGLISKPGVADGVVYVVTGGGEPDCSWRRCTEHAPRRRCLQR